MNVVVERGRLEDVEVRTQRSQAGPGSLIIDVVAHQTRSARVGNKGDAAYVQPKAAAPQDGGTPRDPPNRPRQVEPPRAREGGRKANSNL